MQYFYSHGKLLLTGEYLVLHGALALALPSRFGQKMQVEEKEGEHILQWKNFDMHGTLLANVSFSKQDLQPFRETLKNIDATVLDNLMKALHNCRKNNPAFLISNGSTLVTNTLEFETDFGLGSSSTFVNNLCQWAKADPFVLNKTLFNGSGYDIACAKSDGPLFYKIDKEGIVFDTIHFSPPAQEHIFFIHHGNKQNSKAEIERTNIKPTDFAEEKEMISELSEALLFCDDVNDFMQMLDEHEDIMQFVLQREKLKSAQFPDFNGVIKSLGAWGGDFFLAMSKDEPLEIHRYFQERNYKTIIPYQKMVL